MASNPAQDLQEEFLKTIRKSQETVVEAIKTWVETVQSITPKLPSVHVPLADKLPKPEEVVASAYDFAEQLLAQPAEVRRGSPEGDRRPARREQGQVRGRQGRGQVSPRPHRTRQHCEPRCCRVIVCG